MDKPKVALVKEANVHLAVEKAISLMGGLQRFVKPNERVLLKPNFTCSRDPVSGASTDLRVLEKLVELIRKVGAGEIILAEGAGAIDFKEEFPGIKSFLYETKIGAIDLNQLPREKFRTIPIPDPCLVKELDIPTVVLESQVIINVPKLKVHPDGIVSLAMKNLMGVLCGRGHLEKEKGVEGNEEDIYSVDERMRWIPGPPARLFHNLSITHGPEGFAGAIVDLNTIVSSHLVVLDGTVGMEGAGSPTEGRPVFLDLIIAGDNVVAVDAVAAYIIGFAPERLPHLRLAKEKGLGEWQLDEIEILGEDVGKMRCTFKPAISEHRIYQLS